MDMMKHEQPSNTDEQSADMTTDYMFEEFVTDAKPMDDTKPQFKPQITGRFCEPAMDVHLCEVLPGTPKVAEGRFNVARLRVIRNKKLSADIAILFDDNAEAGVRPKANVAIYLSFDQAQELINMIAATLMVGQ